MYLRMIPAGLGMSTRTTFGEGSTETSHSLHFTVHLAGQNTLKLDTGEVFQNPRYAGVRGNQPSQITAQVNVRPASEERGCSGRMQYFEGVKADDYSSEPFICFEVAPPASDYSLLLNNIRAGMLPSALTIGLQHLLYDKQSPLTYDWAPDGSMKIWHNAKEESRSVAVESIEFHYSVLGSQFLDDDDQVPTTEKASIDAASAAIVAKLGELEKAVVRINGWIITTIIIASAVLYFGRH